MKMDRRLWIIGLLAWIAAACSGLSANEDKYAEVPSGTSLEVMLDQGVNTQVTRPGQPLTASVAAPVMVSGEVPCRVLRVRDDYGDLAEAAVDDR